MQANQRTKRANHEHIGENGIECRKKMRLHVRAALAENMFMCWNECVIITSKIDVRAIERILEQASSTLRLRGLFWRCKALVVLMLLYLRLDTEWRHYPHAGRLLCRPIAQLTVRSSDLDRHDGAQAQKTNW
jgi:hypothetical protein